jgi:hypothetical protein
LNKTLGILGTPHEESIAKFDPTETRPKGGIEEILPRTPQTLELGKPQNRAPLLTDLGGESLPKNHEGFPQISLIKSPRERSRKQPTEITKKGLRKSPPRTIGNNTSKP